MASPSWTQIHPTSLPQSGEHQSKLTLMSESLRNDGRIWVPMNKDDQRPPNDIPEDERDYYLERRYPAFGNLAPRDISSRAAKERIDAGHGVGPLKNAVYLDFRTAIEEYGAQTIKERYGNLFRMYEKITGVDAYKEPMKISPAAHFSMGGLWVDYELATALPGVYALGECNFSDHGANRLGANSLLQACVDGYFIIPYTIGNYLADEIRTGPIDTKAPEFEQAEKQVENWLRQLSNINGSKPVDYFHKKLGKLIWDHCGVTRSEQGLQQALKSIKELEAEFWSDLKVPGTPDQLNSELEKAGRVADYLEMGRLMCIDALTRNESCGAHFREEYQTADGEALRDDENYCFVSCWEHQGAEQEPRLHKEELIFEEIKLAQRSYK